MPASPRLLLPIALLAATSLGGCKKDRDNHHAAAGHGGVMMKMAGIAPPAPAPALTGFNRAAAGQHLAYSHELGLRVPAATLDGHYEAAQAKCLGDDMIKCVLISASIQHDQSSGEASEAWLEVRLPHEAVDPFVKAVSASLPGEQPGAVVVVTQSTRADDLSQPIADTQREIAQLTDYRDRLEALENRASAKTEDLIKLAHELAEAQSDLDGAQTRQRDLSERVDTERLSLRYVANVPDAGPSSPLQEAWRNARRTLIDNAAAALVFAIGALPWIPIVLIGVWIARFAFRRLGWKWSLSQLRRNNSGGN